MASMGSAWAVPGGEVVMPAVRQLEAECFTLTCPACGWTDGHHYGSVGAAFAAAIAADRALGVSDAGWACQQCIGRVARSH